MDDKGENLEALLDGLSKRDIERRQAAAATEQIDLLQEQAGLMMDFVDSLDDDQRDQFVDNIDAMVERAENRQNRDGKGQKGKNPPMIENKTILVVDDDPKIATLLQTYLEECGFAVHTVSNGQLCIDFLSADKPVDALVLDVMMPVMDGFITLQEIRKTSRIPVVMLTARGDHTDRIVGLELGADDYLAKPFHLGRPLARLKAIFRRVQPIQERGDTQPKLKVSLSKMWNCA